MADTDTSVGRRAVLQTLLGGAGVGFALPALADGHPMHEHLGDQARVATAQRKAQASAAAGAMLFLDAHQVATLTVLAEQIVPGSTQAKSAAFIDSLLSVDTEERQRRFVQALSAFDGAALVKAKKPWKSLPEADRTALLTAASTGEPGRPNIPSAQGNTSRTVPGGRVEGSAPPARGERNTNAEQRREAGETGAIAQGDVKTPPGDLPTVTMRDHFDHLKGWISGAYYSSEAGMKELGWTGMMFHEKFPGCQHGGSH